VPEIFTLYSQTSHSLPEPQMRLLAEDADFSVGRTDEGGRSFVIRCPDLTITCNEMPPQNLPDHLDGFCGYVRRILGDDLGERGEQILKRIRHTQCVVGVSVEPERDEGGRAENVLGAMAHGLDALMFHGVALYDKEARLILAPDGTFDEEADVLGPVAAMIEDRVQVRLPEPEERYEATPHQTARYARVLEELRRRRVPTLTYALHVDDDDAITLREPAEVARRVLVLGAVTQRADGGEREQCLEWLREHDLDEHLSPKEREFLESEPADPDQARKLLWRLEGQWALLWALGHLELPWPAGFCDVPLLMKTLRGLTRDPDFVTTARLRPKSEILDALQLTLLQHRAIRDAHIHCRTVPADLDWSGNAPMQPTTASAAVGVVAERHHALNWLTRFGDADWDDVDTPA
jgi:hypothetical protein